MHFLAPVLLHRNISIRNDRRDYCPCTCTCIFEQKSGSGSCSILCSHFVTCKSRKILFDLSRSSGFCHYFPKSRFYFSTVCILLSTLISRFGLSRKHVKIRSFWESYREARRVLYTIVIVEMSKAKVKRSCKRYTVGRSSQWMQRLSKGNNTYFYAPINGTIQVLHVHSVNVEDTGPSNCKRLSHK